MNTSEVEECDSDISVAEFNNLLASHGIPNSFTRLLNMPAAVQAEVWNVLDDFFQTPPVVEEELEDEMNEELSPGPQKFFSSTGDHPQAISSGSPLTVFPIGDEDFPPSLESCKSDDFLDGSSHGEGPPILHRQVPNSISSLAPIASTSSNPSPAVVPGPSPIQRYKYSKDLSYFKIKGLRRKVDTEGVTEYRKKLRQRL